MSEQTCPPSREKQLVKFHYKIVDRGNSCIMLNPNTFQIEEFRKASQRHASSGQLMRGNYITITPEGKVKYDSIGSLFYDIESEMEDSPYELLASYYGCPEWLFHLHEIMFDMADMDIRVDIPNAIRPRSNWSSVMNNINCRLLNNVALHNAGDHEHVVQSVIDIYLNKTQLTPSNMEGNRVSK